MTIFTIDQDKCCKDGLCAAVCPCGIINAKVNETYPEPSKDADEQCINCGHCGAICPHGALQLTTMDTSSWLPTDNNLMPGFDQISQMIRGRRSTRIYKSEPVPRDTIARLIDLSRYAPTAKNSQLLQWLVIDSASELTKLKEHTIAWMRDSVEKKDPSAIAYGFEDVLDALEDNSDPVLRDAPGLIIIHAPQIYPLGLIDSTIAMNTFELAAAAEKIGTCWAGFFMIAAKAWKPLRDDLQLPQGHALTTAMMVGYPKYRYARLPERNKPEVAWR